MRGWDGGAGADAVVVGAVVAGSGANRGGAVSFSVFSSLR